MFCLCLLLSFVFFTTGVDVQNFEPTHYGDISHAKATDDSLEGTTRVIHNELVTNFIHDFHIIQKSLTYASDYDGIVREGIVFCGAGLPQSMDDVDPYVGLLEYFSDKTPILGDPWDGLGGEQALLVNESKVCGFSNCKHDSFVGYIANSIRKMGWHVNHGDICEAAADIPWDEYPIETCQLNGFNGFQKKCLSEDYNCTISKNLYPECLEYFNKTKTECLNNESCKNCVYWWSEGELSMRGPRKRSYEYVGEDEIVPGVTTTSSGNNVKLSDLWDDDVDVELFDIEIRCLNSNCSIYGGHERERDVLPWEPGDFRNKALNINTEGAAGVIYEKQSGLINNKNYWMYQDPANASNVMYIKWYPGKNEVPLDLLAYNYDEKLQLFNLDANSWVFDNNLNDADDWVAFVRFPDTGSETPATYNNKPYLDNMDRENDITSGIFDTWTSIRQRCSDFHLKTCHNMRECEWNGFACKPSIIWIASNLDSPTNRLRSSGDGFSADVSAHYKLSNGTEIPTYPANEIRRETSYQEKLGQYITDRIFVTGVQAANGSEIYNRRNPNNCKSLRQYVAALNGNAQINAFRDEGIVEAENVWLELIRHSTAELRTKSALLLDFYDLSTKMFPLIEFEDVLDECPIGNVKWSIDYNGTENAPLCTMAKYGTEKTLWEKDEHNQELLRSDCFCRSGGDLGKHDEIYLIYNDTNIEAFCDDMETNLPLDLRAYCGMGNTETEYWRKIIEELQPDEDKIKTYGANAIAKRIDIYDKLKQTMKLTESNYNPSCGRLVSTDKTFPTSNKAANCLPFKKLHSVMYRLEYSNSVPGSPDHLDKKGEDTNEIYMLAFEEAIEHTDSSYEQYLLRVVGRANNFKILNGHFLAFDSRSGTGDDAQPMDFDSLHIDPSWHGEQAYNLAIAKNLKNKPPITNKMIWAAIKDEFTSRSKEKIVWKIAKKIAGNFMRVTTTREDDPSVDSGGDIGAEGKATENATSMNN